MNKIGKMFLLLFVSFFMITLSACTADKIDIPDNNTGGIGNDGEFEDVESFATILETATEYSYEMIIDVYDMEENETSTQEWMFAKQGTNEALKLKVDDDTIIFLDTNTYSYSISISNEYKTAIVYDSDHQSDFSNGFLIYFTGFNDTSYKFQKKTNNVQVDGVSTTCYEYNFYGTTYKYYVANDIVVKLEFEDDEERVTLRVKNFKTSNIDTSLFVIPTEALGYTIYDMTEDN